MDNAIFSEIPWQDSAAGFSGFALGPAAMPVPQNRSPHEAKRAGALPPKVELENFLAEDRISAVLREIDVR